MKLLGQESMATWQRYVSAAGTEMRSAAARTRYAMIPNGGEATTNSRRNLI
jgi:integrase/recombinase XerC